jgi:hypothetical protein
MLHYLLLAIGLFFWSKRIGISTFNACFVIPLFAASGLIYSAYFRSSIYFYPICWYPFCAVFAIDIARRPNVFSAFAFAVSLCMTALAGDIFSVGFAGIISALSFLSALHGKDTPNKILGYLRQVPVLLIIVFICLGFVVYQSQSMLKISNRAHGFTAADVLFFSFHPIRFLEFFFNPFELFGLTSKMSEFQTGAASKNRWWHESVYMGPLAAALVIVGIKASFKDKKYLYYLGGFLVFAFLAMGSWNPIVNYLVEVMPQKLRIFRYPAKLLVPAFVALFPILMLGNDRILTTLKSRLSPSNFRLALIFYALALITPPALQSLKNQIFIPSATFDRPPILRELPPFEQDERKFAVFAGIDTKPYRYKDIPTDILTSYGPAIWGERQTICTDSALSDHFYIHPKFFHLREVREAYGVTHLVVFDKMNLNQQLLRKDVLSGELNIVAEDEANKIIIIADKKPIKRARIIDKWKISDTSHLGNPENISIENGRAIVHKHRRINSQGVSTNITVNHTPSDTHELCLSEVSGDFKHPPEVSTFVTDSKCKTMLVVNASFVNGWIAQVNGVETDIYNINHMMIGIPLQPGKNTIELTYTPQFFESYNILNLALQSIFLLMLPLVLLGRKNAEGHI